jgi:hypothetical protein
MEGIPRPLTIADSNSSAGTRGAGSEPATETHLF